MTIIIAIARLMIVLFAGTLLSGSPAIAATYSTTFPAAENPISEGGNWINGGAVGLDWANVQTTPSLAFGTQSGSSGQYDDSTALLTGTWNPDHTAEATVRALFDLLGAHDYAVEP